MTKRREKMLLKAIPSLLAHGEQLEAFYDEKEEKSALESCSFIAFEKGGKLFLPNSEGKEGQSGLQLSVREERQAWWLTWNTIDRTSRRLSRSQ